MTAPSDSPAAGLAAAPPRAAERDLHVVLDAPLPAQIGVGAGTALFVCGWCSCAHGRIRDLSFVVDGAAEPVTAQRMPRLDVFRDLHPGLDVFASAGLERDPASAKDPLLQAYRSGFWGFARVTAAAGECELVLRAELDDGSFAEAQLGRIATVDPRAPASVEAPEFAAGPLVAICMATYNPPADLLERQLDSIRAQTHRNWVCLVSDDGSSPERFAALRDAVEGDPRFVVSRSPRRLGFFGNFERALGMVPPGAKLVAMADQDDAWYPDKLEALIDGLGCAQLVYSDARIVGRGGETISESYWERRRNNHAELLSMLVANAVTGAASLFRAELLADALPFPPAQFGHYHDHWIALTALALGEIAFVDRPLYDYVQHAGAHLGHAAATDRGSGLRERLPRIAADPRERVRLWRGHYFLDAARVLQLATILQMRVGARMARPKRRILERFLDSERSLVSLADLWRRGTREILGRHETNGAEWVLAYAFTWRRLLDASLRERPNKALRLDAVPPPRLAPRPGPRVAEGPARAVSLKVAPLELSVRDDAPTRVNLLMPTIDLEHLFGGYIAKLNLARRLAERGARVRLVTVDPVAPLPPSWRARVESFEGLDGLFDQVEIAFGRELALLEVSPTDAFVATTWWSAHIAAAAVRTLGRERFLYLIQEHEPFTFPMGTYAALADESYRLPHAALFSTELLRDFFRRRGLGVYGGGPRAGDAASAAFENAITAVAPPAAEQLAARGTRRLLFYARPEPHAARNMFELGVLALSRALEQGALRDWELNGIGTLDDSGGLELGSGASLSLLPRASQRAYARTLREHDVGLALMYTPHPSLVPIEMASAGMLTVTNSFENKTAAAMAAISTNLITAEPGVEAIADALCEAAAGARDAERRARGSAVRWSRDWDRSFDDALLARVEGFLR